MFTIPVRMVRGPTVSSLSPLICKTILIKGIHLDCWGGIKEGRASFILRTIFFFVCALILLFCSRMPNIEHNCKDSAVQKRKDNVLKCLVNA